MCLPFGTTTMLDAGGPGWKTFDIMKDKVIRKSKTRVFSLLNIVGSGMVMDGEQNVSDMDAEATAEKIKDPIDATEQNLSELDILSKEDDKVLEIPAFLRRQVN